MNTVVQHPARLLTPGAVQIAIALATRALHTPRYIADVFISWSPHCDSMTVDIHAHGWISHDSPNYCEPSRFNLMLDREEKYLESDYQRIIAILDKLEEETAASPDREKLIAETKAYELRNQAAKLLNEAEQLSPSKNEIPDAEEVE